MINYELTDEFGNYTLNAHFSSPGDYTFPLGLTLEVLDSCVLSEFPNAPVIEPYDVYYFGGNQGELDLDVTWEEDTTTAANDFSCGDYSIEVTYNSEASSFEHGTIDFEKTKYEVVGTSGLKFISS